MRDLGILLAIAYTTLLFGLAIAPVPAGTEPDVYSKKFGWPKIDHEAGPTGDSRCCVKKGDSKCLPC